MSFALIMLGGMALDLVLGWPEKLYVRIGHPVTWLGHVISQLDRLLNTGSQRRKLATGAFTAFIVVLLAALPMMAIQSTLPKSWVGIVLASILAWPMIALRSMHDHVLAVLRPLEIGDLPAARHAVSMIVGRDPNAMDSAAIARAATESLAENTSDGIVAPLFWGTLFGLPGIFAYKAINTMDSMIGHRNDRFEQFGKVAARLDDAVNWVPARLTGAMFACVSGGPAQSFRVMLHDAPKHRSPNAGWPEGAMAGGLGIRLSGPRRYGTHRVEEPWLNSGAPDPTANDLARALKVYRYTMVLCGVVLAAVALL